MTDSLLVMVGCLLDWLIGWIVGEMDVGSDDRRWMVFDTKPYCNTFDALERSADFWFGFALG